MPGAAGDDSILAESTFGWLGHGRLYCCNMCCFHLSAFFSGCVRWKF